MEIINQERHYWAPTAVKEQLQCLGTRLCRNWGLQQLDCILIAHGLVFCFCFCFFLTYLFGLVFFNMGIQFCVRKLWVYLFSGVLLVLIPETLLSVSLFNHHAWLEKSFQTRLPRKATELSFGLSGSKIFAEGVGARDRNLIGEGYKHFAISCGSWLLKRPWIIIPILASYLSV